MSKYRIVGNHVAAQSVLPKRYTFVLRSWACLLSASITRNYNNNISHYNKKHHQEETQKHRQMHESTNTKISNQLSLPQHWLQYYKRYEELHFKSRTQHKTSNTTLESHQKMNPNHSYNLSMDRSSAICGDLLGCTKYNLNFSNMLVITMASELAS